MVDIESLLPKLTRVDGTPLDENDSAKLKVFHSKFTDESDSELERKRGVMRDRLHAHETLKQYRDNHNFDRLLRRAGLTKEDHHLDQAKFDILTAIIQDRTRGKLQPPTPSPSNPHIPLTGFQQLLIATNPRRMDMKPLNDSDREKLRAFYEEMRQKTKDELWAAFMDLESKITHQMSWQAHRISEIADLNHAKPAQPLDWQDPHLDLAKQKVVGELHRNWSEYRTKSPYPQPAISSDTSTQQITTPATKKDEMFHLKPNLWGVGIDLKVLWRRLFRGKPK